MEHHLWNILLMEKNPAPVEVGRLSHHLQGYIHPNGSCLALLNHQQNLQQKSYGSFGGPGTSYTKISRQRGQILLLDPWAPTNESHFLGEHHGIFVKSRDETKAYQTSQRSRN